MACCINWSAACAPAWAISGAANLGSLRERARFVRVSPAAVSESHTHGVAVTREAPNYPRNL